MSTRVPVDFGSRSYEILIESGGPGGVADALVERLGTRHVAVLTDENVGPLYLDEVLRALRSAGCEADALTIGVGEVHKVAATAERSWAWLLERGYDRNAVVLALGGGVVGDLAGFVASTWMRGVALVAVPTTLLAQVDSSVGGKTGFNLSGAKNIVGTFHQPSLVYAGLGALKTLEARDFRAGLAEVVKHGVIGRPAILDRLETDAEAVLALNPDRVAELVGACCEVKRDVVQADEREGGRRKVLNLGHTFGHAIETVSGHGIRHGEAVAIGLVAAARLSEKLGCCGPEPRERITQLLERLGLDADDGPWWTPEVARAMRSDKKRRGAAIDQVVIHEVGEVSIRRLAAAELEDMVARGSR